MRLNERFMTAILKNRLARHNSSAPSAHATSASHQETYEYMTQISSAPVELIFFYTKTYLGLLGYNSPLAVFTAVAACPHEARARKWRLDQELPSAESGHEI